MMLDFDDCGETRCHLMVVGSNEFAEDPSEETLRATLDRIGSERGSLVLQRVDALEAPVDHIAALWANPSDCYVEFEHRVKHRIYRSRQRVRRGLVERAILAFRSGSPSDSIFYDLEPSDWVDAGDLEPVHEDHYAYLDYLATAGLPPDSCRHCGETAWELAPFCTTGAPDRWACGGCSRTSPFEAAAGSRGIRDC